MIEGEPRYKTLNELYEKTEICDGPLFEYPPALYNSKAVGNATRFELPIFGIVNRIDGSQSRKPIKR